MKPLSKTIAMIAALFLAVYSLFLFKNIQPIETEKEESEKEFPSEWLFAQRAYPNGQINQTAYLEVLKNAQRLRNQSLTTRGSNTWTLAGPTNTGGRITSLAIHPSNTQTIYVGAAAGGIFKSTDGGASWLSIFEDALTLAIGDVAIAPSNPQTLYVGTGEANGGGGSTNYDGVGVYKSLNAGATWQHLGPTNIGSIGKLAIDPKNPNRVFVAAMGYLYQPNPQRGVYRTTDGGGTWDKVLYLNDSTGCIDIAIHPTNSDTIYAAMWERNRRPNYRNYGGASCGIYRSIDGGSSWLKLINGLPDTNIGRIGITISPKDPSVLYTIYADEIGNFKGIYRSNNNGDSWFQLDPNSQLKTLYSNFGWWFGRIVADPFTTEGVYVMGLDIFKTMNGGQTWQFVSDGVHVDHHALWANPNDSLEVINGNDGGLYRSKTITQAWNQVNNLPITQFYTCEIDERNPQRLYGGTQDNGTWRTQTGNTNDWEHIFDGDGFVTLVDPNDNKYVYAEAQYGFLARSTDGGANFVTSISGIISADRKNWQVPYVFAPNNSSTLYLGTHRLYRSTNRAVSWTPISSDLTNGSQSIGGIIYGTITTISVSPVNPQIIYVGTDDANVWVSTNGGSNFQKINNNIPNRWITHVEADPKDASTAYVTVSGFKWNEYQPHVLKTTNQGATWVDISSNLPQAPVNDIVADPSVSGTLYVATDVGVYVSNNGGGQWQPLGNGLPLVPVTDLRLHNATRKLVAATFGRSMYSIILEPTATKDLSLTDFNLQISPTIVSSNSNIHLNLSKNSDISLEIIDISGKMIKKIAAGQFPIGEYNFPLNRFDFKASGIYLCRLASGGGVKTLKFMVL